MCVLLGSSTSGPKPRFQTNLPQPVLCNMRMHKRQQGVTWGAWLALVRYRAYSVRVVSVVSTVSQPMCVCLLSGLRGSFDSNTTAFNTFHQMVGRWRCEVPLVEGVLQTVVDVETLIEIGFQNSSKARCVFVWVSSQASFVYYRLGPFNAVASGFTKHLQLFRQ